MANTSLARLVNDALPAVSGSSLTYNADRNMFLTTGYTSAAGNTYFQGIHLSNRLAIVFDIGIGYARTFLNGLQVYCFDGREKKLIGSRSYACVFYTDSRAQREAAEVLLEYLMSQAKLVGAYVSDSELEAFAQQQVLAAATNRPQLTA
ncbi:MAG: hypothetical protein MJZ74_00820 [Muribaculaceae bacterium]|nr:hypothetical protein [Muribaculaceae bacterium]